MQFLIHWNFYCSVLIALFVSSSPVQAADVYFSERVVLGPVPDSCPDKHEVTAIFPNRLPLATDVAFPFKICAQFAGPSICDQRPLASVLLTISVTAQGDPTHTASISGIPVRPMHQKAANAYKVCHNFSYFDVVALLKAAGMVEADIADVRLTAMFAVKGFRGVKAVTVDAAGTTIDLRGVNPQPTRIQVRGATAFIKESDLCTLANDCGPLVEQLGMETEERICGIDLAPIARVCAKVPETTGTANQAYIQSQADRGPLEILDIAAADLYQGIAKRDRLAIIADIKKEEDEREKQAEETRRQEEQAKIDRENAEILEREKEEQKQKDTIVEGIEKEFGDRRDERKSKLDAMRRDSGTVQLFSRKSQLILLCLVAAFL